MTQVWEIIESIVSKENWYQKIFYEDVVGPWKHEIKDNTAELNTALRILRATAKGCLHMEECTWQDGPEYMCEECTRRYLHLCIDEDTDETMEDSDEMIKISRENFDPYDGPKYICTHKCLCKEPDYDLFDYIVSTNEVINGLKESIEELSNQIEVDWHPNSNDQVRDIVHPSMYPHIDMNKEENKRYQWLPSNMININGVFKFSSKINNCPDSFKEVLAGVFNKFIPAFNKVTSKYIDSRKKIQVIVKVGTTYISEEKPFPGGSWHIEGMPYEHIIATGIHYVKGVDDSFLEFRKPTILFEEELDYPQGDGLYTTHHYGITPGTHYDGKMNRYLGLIKCEEGVSIVFPNSLQHRVKEIKSSGERTIVAFFLIDPNVTLISTEDEPNHTISKEEAVYHRERLMFTRKYFVDDLNKEVYERSFSLCEH